MKTKSNKLSGPEIEGVNAAQTGQLILLGDLVASVFLACLPAMLQFGAQTSVCLQQLRLWGSLALQIRSLA